MGSSMVPLPCPVGETKRKLLSSTVRETGTTSGSMRPSSTWTSKSKVPEGAGAQVMVPLGSMDMPAGASFKEKTSRSCSGS
jgi:hypothetical protein